MAVFLLNHKLYTSLHTPCLSALLPPVLSVSLSACIDSNQPTWMPYLPPKLTAFVSFCLSAYLPLRCSPVVAVNPSSVQSPPIAFAFVSGRCLPPCARQSSPFVRPIIGAGSAGFPPVDRSVGGRRSARARRRSRPGGPRSVAGRPATASFSDRIKAFCVNGSARALWPLLLSIRPSSDRASERIRCTRLLNRMRELGDH